MGDGKVTVRDRKVGRSRSFPAFPANLNAIWTFPCRRKLHLQTTIALTVANRQAGGKPLENAMVASARRDQRP